jgi:hypothetical protein
LVAALGGLALLTSGCTTPLHPKPFEVQQSSIPNLEARQPVAIRARLDGGPKRTLQIAGPDVVVSEDEFTTALVDRIIQTLRDRTVPLDPNSQRAVEFQVVRVSLQPTMDFDCVIDFNRKLGDGRLHGLQSRAKSWNFEKACAAAVSQAVVDALNDPDTRTYLEGN